MLLVIQSIRYTRYRFNEILLLNVFPFIIFTVHDLRKRQPCSAVKFLANKSYYMVDVEYIFNDSSKTMV